MAQDLFADQFVKLCIDPSLNFYDGACRVLVEGQMLASGTATPDVLIPVPTDRDLDALFGAGSQLAETLRQMFCTCDYGTELQVIPRSDPAGSVAAEFDLLPVGPVTAAGRAELYMLGEGYSIDYYQPAGETNPQMAARLAAAIIDQVGDKFPYAVTVVGSAVHLIAKNKGTVGNYLVPIFNWRNLANYTAVGMEFTYTQTVQGAGDLTALDYASIIGTCCYSCFALLGDGVAYQTGWQLYLESLWSCDTPQCFGHGYTYNVGDSAAVIPRGTNAAVLSRIAYCEDFPVPPHFLVGAYASLSCCSACSNPELSIQGRNYGVLTCLKMPETCSTCYSSDDQVLLREAGFVVVGPLSGGTGAYTSPYIFNDVTNYLYDSEGRPNATFRDTSSRRLTAATAISIAEHLQQYSALALFTKNTSIKQGIFGTNPRLMLASIRAWAKDNIGVLFSEFDNIDEDIVLRTDFEVTKNCRGKPGRLHLMFTYRPPVRVDQIKTTFRPKLLENCVR